MQDIHGAGALAWDSCGRRTGPAVGSGGWVAWRLRCGDSGLTTATTPNRRHHQHGDDGATQPGIPLQAPVRL